MIQLICGWRTDLDFWPDTGLNMHTEWDFIPRFWQIHNIYYIVLAKLSSYRSIYRFFTATRLAVCQNIIFYGLARNGPNRMGQIYTLGSRNKSYPDISHIPVYPIYGSTPPLPPFSLINHYIRIFR